MEEILYLFHHIHHENGEHMVHHCGGRHEEIDPDVDYKIRHCPCGKHSINKKTASGHTVDSGLQLENIRVRFQEKCPKGGWHIESGTKG